MKTIVDLLENSVRKHADNSYLLEKKGDKFEATTFLETSKQVSRVAAGFLAPVFTVGTPQNNKHILIYNTLHGCPGKVRKTGKQVNQNTINPLLFPDEQLPDASKQVNIGN